jgi:hypothetical protein
MADASQGTIWIVPANTPASAPRTAANELGPSIVRRILLTWPAGCAGQVFVQVQASGGYAFPNQQGQFMAFDDYTYAIDVSNQTTSGHWRLLTYNTDQTDHAIQVIYEFDYLRGDMSTTQLQAVAL